MVDFCQWLSRYSDPSWRVFRFEDVRREFGSFYGKWLTFTEQQRKALGSYSRPFIAQLADAVAHLSLTQALEAN